MRNDCIQDSKETETLIHVSGCEIINTRL